MKVDEHKLRQQSTLGEGIRMTIDADAAPHLMDVLTKQYANPLLAVIREYSTNASDANIEAGSEQPIEVTLPTTANPVLTITDFGPGLDREDIAEIYSKFGASTKRGTNDAVGQLGIGCKSALAYTDQFTVVGRKDGLTTTVLVGRDEDGGASMTPVDASALFEPDGVTVQVPIKPNDIDHCGTLTRRFFKFWPEGTVLVNGTAPRRVGKAADGGDTQQGNIWLDDRTLLTVDEDVEESLVVMGGVPYPLVGGMESLWSGGQSRSYRDPTWHAVVFVPIGAVNFAPSRESLMDTKRTRSTLDQARTHIKAALEKRIREQIAAAPTAKEAQQKLRDGISLMGSAQALKGAQWNGREVVLKLQRQVLDTKGDPVYFNPDDAPVEEALKYSYLYVNHNNYARKAGERTTSFDLGSTTDWHVIVGFDGKVMTNVKRAKLELFMQAKGYTHLPKLMAVDKLTPDEKFWLNGWTFWKWEDIAAIELPKQTTADGGTTRLRGSYECMIDGQYNGNVSAASIPGYLDGGRPLYWFHGNARSASYQKAVKSGAVSVTNALVVGLGANRIDKFIRDFPQAVKLGDAAAAAGKAWLKTLDPNALKAYSIQRSSDIEVLKLLDVSKLDDPELVKLHALCAADTSGIVSGLQKYASWVSVESTKGGAAWADKILAKYPLLTSLNRYSVSGQVARDHTILYLNSAYAAQKGA